jgi:hypothetical protein
LFAYVFPLCHAVELLFRHPEESFSCTDAEHYSGNVPALQLSEVLANVSKGTVSCVNVAWIGVVFLGAILVGNSVRYKIETL